MRSRTLAVTLVALALTAAAAVMWQAKAYEERNTFRLKMTATVIVDGVERSGRSVQEFRLESVNEPQIGRGNAWRLLVRGEGVVIEVPGEAPVYVMISANPVFERCGIPHGTQSDIAAHLRNIQRCEFERAPTAIRFTSKPGLAEPMTVDGKGHNGLLFVSYVAERTNEPVTAGVVGKLPSDEKGLIHVPYGELIQTLSSSDFTREQYR